MVRLAAVLIGLVALAGPNLAMAEVEMRGEPSCGKGNDGKPYCSVELTLRGTIDEAMSVELSRKLQQVPGTISSLDVHLDSPGGAVGPALDIGRQLRSRKADVVVLQKDRCASACVLIYSSGVMRAAPGKIGIHRPYLEVGAQARTMAEIKTVMDQMLAQIRKYLVEMNVDPRLADDMMRIPPEQVRYLTDEDRDAYGLGAFDPVWQEEADLSASRRLGITRQEYMRRHELGMRLCQGVLPGVQKWQCWKHYESGNTSRFVSPVPTPPHTNRGTALGPFESIPIERQPGLRTGLSLDKALGIEVLTLADGSRYEGEFRDGTYNGRGVFTWADGSRYEGEFSDGKKNGRGVLSVANGMRYEGEFRDGKVNGRGVQTWPNGSRYEGEFRAGDKNGRGVFTFANGNRYEGEFRDNKENGRGVVTLANSSLYEGEFRDGKYNGRGVFTSANGDRYEGEFRNDRPHGLGIYTTSSGTFNGVWREGCFRDGGRRARVGAASCP